jgi:hypothetical protein
MDKLFLHELGWDSKRGLAGVASRRKQTRDVVSDRGQARLAVQESDTSHSFRFSVGVSSMARRTSSGVRA